MKQVPHQIAREGFNTALFPNTEYIYEREMLMTKLHTGIFSVTASTWSTTCLSNMKLITVLILV